LPENEFSQAPSPSTRVVLFFEGGGPLLLRDIQRNEAGHIVSGYVENGHWDFTYNPETACLNNGYENLFAKIVREVIVPKGYDGDYNRIISDAITLDQLPAPDLDPDFTPQNDDMIPF